MRCHTFWADCAQYLHDPVCHPPSFPFTMPSISDTLAPTGSVLSSTTRLRIRDGKPAVLCANVPWLKESIVPWRALDVARSGSADGSV